MAVETADRPQSYFATGWGARAWLATTDHKRVAWLYFAALTFFFFIGGAMAVTMRLELASPAGDLVSDDIYNRLFSIHGIIMIWFFLVPSIPATLGNFLPGMPITRDQYELLKAGSVTSDSYPGLADLGVTPRPLGLFLDRWMVSFRKHGRFGESETAPR